MTPDEYIQSVGNRLQANGAEVSTQLFQGMPALVGRGSQFRLRWTATRQNLLFVVIGVQTVTVKGLEQFAHDALDYAISQNGRFRGSHNGVAAVPVMVGDHADPDAASFARTELIRRFAAFAWPTAVDLQAGIVHEHEGRVVVGGMYAGWMRQQIEMALPKPTA
jgi:hypothetical protein